MLKQRSTIYVCALLMDFGLAGIFFAVTRRAAELGATGIQLGALAASWAAVYGVLVLFTGRWSDRVGRRRMALSGLATAGVFMLACGFTTNVPLLLALMVGVGFGAAAFWPPIIGWLGDDAPSPARLNARLGRFSIAWTVGFLLGSAVVAAVFRVSRLGSFFVTALPVFTAFVLLALPAAPETRAETGAVPASLPPVPKGRGFRKAGWLANFAVTLTTSGVCALFPQLATHLGIRADVHGGMLALFRAGSLVAFFALAYWTYWRTRLWPMWIAQAIGVVALAVIGFASEAWVFAVAFTVAGIVGGYTYLASIFFTLEEIAEKGKGSGFHEAVLGVGIFLGSILAGVAGEYFSVRSPYFLCAGILGLLVVAQMILVFVRRRATVAP